MPGAGGRWELQGSGPGKQLQAAPQLLPRWESTRGLENPILLNVAHRCVLFQSFVLTWLVLMLRSDGHR